MGNSIRYYVTGHTAKGYVNYLFNNLQGIERIFSLHHPSNFLKTALLQQLMGFYEDKYFLEIILSEKGSGYLEGVVVPNLSLAIVTDTIAKGDSKIKSIKLENFFPKTKQTNQFEKDLERLYEKSHLLLKEALEIHEQLEAVYIQEMDFSKANQMAENFIEEVLKNVSTSDQESIIKRRLFGTNTHEGAVNIVPELLKRVNKRFYLKGRAGTGKSTFMRKIKEACKQKGLNIEVYHCSFDPESIDMVLVPEANFCIFDSTGPHEFFPEEDDDQIIDLYEGTVTPGTDEKYQKEIASLTKKYREKIKEAMETLQQSKEPQIALEKEYSFTVEEIDELFQKLENYFIKS